MLGIWVKKFPVLNHFWKTSLLSSKDVPKGSLVLQALVWPNIPPLSFPLSLEQSANWKKIHLQSQIIQELEIKM